MSRAGELERQASEISTVKNLTGVFESLASTQVAKVKNKAQLSKDFFELLWSRYSSIRIDEKTRITNRTLKDKNQKSVFVVISAEAGLSGDIDQRLISVMQKEYDPVSTDIVVLGSHGAQQLSQHNISYIKFYKVPESDEYIDVSPIIAIISNYARIVVYYEEYVSLGVQNIRSIDLISSIKTLSEDVEDGIMTSDDTIFEPSLDEIADEMELTMMSLALSETILESSLAQSASRFNAMAVAKKRAGELFDDFIMDFHRAKRADSDRRLREVLIALKKKRKTQGGAR